MAIEPGKSPVGDYFALKGRQKDIAGKSKKEIDNLMKTLDPIAVVKNKWKGRSVGKVVIAFNIALEKFKDFVGKGSEKRCEEVRKALITAKNVSTAEHERLKKVNKGDLGIVGKDLGDRKRMRDELGRMAVIVRIIQKDRSEDDPIKDLREEINELIHENEKQIEADKRLMPGYKDSGGESFKARSKERSTHEEISHLYGEKSGTTVDTTKKGSPESQMGKLTFLTPKQNKELNSLFTILDKHLGEGGDLGVSSSSAKRDILSSKSMTALYDNLDSVANTVAAETMGNAVPEDLQAAIDDFKIELMRTESQSILDELNKHLIDLNDALSKIPKGKSHDNIREYIDRNIKLYGEKVEKLQNAFVGGNEEAIRKQNVSLKEEIIDTLPPQKEITARIRKGLNVEDITRDIQEKAKERVNNLLKNLQKDTSFEDDFVDVDFLKKMILVIKNEKFSEKQKENLQKLVVETNALEQLLDVDVDTDKQAQGI